MNLRQSQKESWVMTGYHWSEIRN